MNGVGQNKETDDEHDVIVLQRVFSRLGSIENVREGSTLSVWRIVVSILEIDQN